MRTVFFLVVVFGLSMPVDAQVTRIDQTDPSIAYSGNWYSNTSTAHNGGTAALTNTRGARATLTFNGTGITWLGVLDGWSGLATIYLDGAMQTIDTFASMSRYQAPLFTAHGLSGGPHTFSIEVLHERDANTQGSWVWIDAFEIENGASVPGGISAGAGRIEENNPALLYTGRWYSNGSPVHSSGSAVLAMDAGSRVNVAFNGTGISWLAYRDEWSGVARVYVDGVEKTTVDNYQSPAAARVTPFILTGLSAGAHTFTIEATGTRSANAKGAWVWVDGFDVIP
jgi:hypothetical protein